MKSNDKATLEIFPVVKESSNLVNYDNFKNKTTEADR